MVSGDEPRSALPGSGQFTLAVHGPAVAIECGVERLCRPIELLLGCFSVPTLAADSHPALGFVQPFDHADVSRYLSPTARRVSDRPGLDGLTEVYEEGERFWVVDDRWGMAEINLLRGTWRSWVLPEPRLDPLRCAEAAVVWPLAQLLRGKGVHLLPAASAVRDGWAVLLFCNFPLEPELTALLDNGYRLIGQRWTAIREEEGRLALLHMPGWVDRPFAPRLRIGPGGGEAADELDRAGCADLTADYRGATQSHAFCDGVAITEPGRRPRAGVRPVGAAEAVALLRRAWPLPELHPNRRLPVLLPKLARLCRCGEVQLSRNPRDVLALLAALQSDPLTLSATDALDLDTESEQRDVAA